MVLQIIGIIISAGILIFNIFINLNLRKINDIKKRNTDCCIEYISQYDKLFNVLNSSIAEFISSGLEDNDKPYSNFQKYTILNCLLLIDNNTDKIDSLLCNIACNKKNIKILDDIISDFAKIKKKLSKSNEDFQDYLAFGQKHHSYDDLMKFTRDQAQSSLLIENFKLTVIKNLT